MKRFLAFLKEEDGVLTRNSYGYPLDHNCIGIKWGVIKTKRFLAFLKAEYGVTAIKYGLIAVLIAAAIKCLYSTAITGCIY